MSDESCSSRADRARDPGEALDPRHAFLHTRGDERVPRLAGLHDMMTGHVWAQLPRPDLPPSVAVSARAFEFMYQSRRPSLRDLGLTGGGSFLVLLLVTAAAYRWNNRRLPVPPISRAAEPW